MTFEELLIQELRKIEALNDNVYPLAVPQDVKAPYIAISLAGGDYLHCLDGDWPQSLDYEVNILSKSVAQIKTLETSVNEVLKGLNTCTCSEGVVRQVVLEVPTEQYEEATKLQRSNIQFTVYF